MIIMSQDKNEIFNFNNIVNIQVTNCNKDGYLISAGLIVGKDDNYRDLGYYKTEERAKEVLQEIVNLFGIRKIENKSYEEADLIMKFKKQAIYEMPKE